MIRIFALAVLLLAPMSISATESDEAMEVVSNDVTGTWSAINSGLTNTHVNTLAIDSLTPSTIYAGTDGGVFKSTDGGGSWSASGLPYACSILAISPSNPSILYATVDSHGLFKTTDGGAHWADFTPADRPPGTFVNYVLVIDPSDPSTFYGSYSHVAGVFKLFGGGPNWSFFGFGFPVYALAIDPSNSSIIYAGTYGGGVFKSTDEAANWSPMSDGLTNLNVYALAINPTNTSIIYAGTDGGVFKSTNGGGSWRASGLANTHINVLAIDPSDPTFIYAGTNGGVFESTDGGGNWSAINSGLTNTHVASLAIDPSNPDIYAGTNGGVFKSSSAEGPPSLHVSKSGTGDGRVTSNPSGIDCGSACAASYDEGTIVTLTANPSSGSAFAGWSGGGCSGTGPCTITLSSNTIITASFALSGNCAYTVSPANKTFKANGGTVSIKVSATGLPNCPVPPVNTNAEWISVSGTPPWKANKETIKIAVQKNPISQSRTGVVSIGGEHITIVEDGAICQLTALKPSSGKYPNRWQREFQCYGQSPGLWVECGDPV